MFYCPKCRKTYEDGSQRFCANDGARLVSSPSAPQSVKQTGGVFTNLLSRVSSPGDGDEKISPTPKFVKVETKNYDHPISRPSADESFFFTQPESKQFPDSPIAVQKPLLPKINKNEVKKDQPKLSEPNFRLTPENADLLLGRTVKNRYQIYKKLEADETEIAYLAVDKKETEKKVRIQFFMGDGGKDEIADKIFAEERNSLSLINHSNIAGILDSGELFDGKSFIISEFAEGISVREMLTKNSQINALRTARIIRQAAAALGEAHRNGVLHRNLTPDNIILTVSNGNELVKVTGLAARKDGLSNQNLSYKSPEQISGRSANLTGDIFSLGVIAYQMLTGRLPFSGTSTLEVQKSQRDGLSLHPTNLRLDLPEEIDELLDKTLALNPSDRFLNADDFGESFYRVLTSETKYGKTPEEVQIEIIDDKKEEFKVKPKGTIEFASNETESVAFDTAPSISQTKDEFREKLLYPTAEAELPENVGSEISYKEKEEFVPEKQTFQNIASSPKSLVLFAILAILVLSTAIWGLWRYVINRPPELQIVQTMPESSFATPDIPMENTAPTPVDIEIPPLPRNIPQPPNSIYFQNTKETIKGDLAKNYLGFSLYYPENWKKNKAEGKFLDISNDALSGTPIEQMLLSYYDSKGAYKSDIELFPALVEETNKTLKEIVSKYEMVSEGKTTFNNGWQAYEVKFKGSGTTGKGEDITLWGRRLFVPTGRPGMKNGYVITMIATSLSPDVENVEDVGVKGELSDILESFEPNQNF